MPIDPKKCCGTHSKEKEDNGECCQVKDQENAQALTYEHSIKTGPEPKSVSHLLQEGMEQQRRLENE